MGIGGSKASCLSISPDRHKAQAKINHGEEDLSRHTVQNLSEERLSVSQPSCTSLRRASKSSIKPGQRLSLQSSHGKFKELTSIFDPDDLISIHDLYNMLNDGSMKPYIHDPFNLLLVDTRDLDAFSTNHVITSKHHNTVMDTFTGRLNNYSMIIMYGCELKEDGNSKRMSSLRENVMQYVACDVLVLKEGFEVFQSVYPFLCTEKNIESIADRKLLVSYPSAVLENMLYQGRGDQATNEGIVNVLKITHIVNITTEHRNAFPSKIKYLKLVLEDVSETNLFNHFYNTSDFINNAISKNGRVLVHCNQGVSRSSTITIAYLMRFKKWNLQHAFSILKARRSCTCPNPGFLKQLSDWEEEIFGKRETNIDSL
ncbi:probable rhodanese domain-containing dual specificity protein phosphatase [Hydractinia symbiolongicarpus]|uniref:probable rhodanese domain-containing dual specificity protein phosphatase n=1 Tax=Hydractinia symbiolongicarpus TaxID=13093 RepID=UPI00254C55C7|nr:probable rhodanese domain-containing dual specificity protein phosphatase [Hydractinia symbiolongicarpus]